MSNQTPERPDHAGTPQGWPVNPANAQQPGSPYPGQAPASGQPASTGTSAPNAVWGNAPSASNGTWGNTPTAPSGSWSSQASASNGVWNGQTPPGAWNGQTPPATTSTSWGSQPGTPPNSWGGAYGAPADPQNPYSGQSPQQTLWGSPQTSWTAQQSGPWGPGTPPGVGQFPPGAPNNDPRVPLGAPVPASVGIEQLTERRSRTPLYAGLAIALVVALALVLGTRAINRPQPAPTPTATPSSATSQASSATGSSNSVPFENDRDESAGTWSIDKYAWNGDELLITTTVSATKGTQPMAFFAIADDSETQSYTAVASGRPDDVLGKQVASGQTVTGTVMFRMPHQESTIFLTDSNDRQVTALVVNG